MKVALRRTAVLACALGLAVAPAAPALAHDGRIHAAAKSAALPPVPLVTSDNVSLVTTLPETLAISMEFARTGPFAYVSSLDTISVLDLTNPRSPQLKGTLVNAMFENEAMTYGERIIAGKLTRFVIAGIDIVQTSPNDPEHINVLGDEFLIVDVTDPAKPFIRSRASTTTSTHTVQCVDQADCTYAYTAGTGGKFSILDFTDLDKPKELKTVLSSAAGPNPVFSRGAGHYWDFDGVLGWHTGSGGAQAFNVDNPVNPTPVTGTDAKGRVTPYNDFILHNSMRPNAKSFKPGAPPSIDNGNVLLVTEEDYVNDGDEILCDRAGSFQTWYVPDLDAAAYRSRNTTGGIADKGTVTPLDITNAPDEFGGGISPPAGGFCSAHWFDVHQDGFVAIGHYQQGLRILDVRDPRNIKQFGYSTSVATETWDAYWVPQRDAAGVAIPGRKTNLVYTADNVRGIDVYEVTLPKPAAAAPPGAPAAPPQAPPGGGAPPPSAPGTGGTLASTGVETWLPLAALALMGGALVARRRRTAA